MCSQPVAPPPWQLVCLLLCGLLVSALIEPVAVLAAPHPAAPVDEAEQEKFFESKVRPLLVEHCIECHGPEEQSGELRLDRLADFQRGGGSGPVVVPGKPDTSRLIRAIGFQDNDLQMPPDQKLSEEAIQTLTEWVRRGAYWSPQETEGNANGDAAPVKMSMAEQIESQRQTHWAFQPIVATEPPSNERILAHDSGVSLAAGELDSLTPIDRFVLDRLGESSLAPNPRADRRVLIHRAYFTLLGLPPTYEDVQSFINDPAPDAFARLVDRLLDNPHYGERWARHWLDIARYGDTTGYLAGSRETRYPYAYTFRDYVIDAFNADKPFDEFIVEQIAADRLDVTGEERSALAAMGFLTVGRRFMNRTHDIIDDRIDVVSRGFLGLSVACARCHDHKFDPIPTADYYSLYGVFASSEEPEELPLLGEPQASPEYQAFLQAQAEKQAEVDKWVEARRVDTEQELRSRVADYLVYVAKSLPQYKQGKTPLQGQRGALRRAAAKRWQQYLDQPAESLDPIWHLWHDLAALPADTFAAQAATILDDDAHRQVPESLLAAVREAKPQSMPAAAQTFGDRLEAVYAQWVEAVKADAGRTQLADEDDERLRQSLLAADAPTTLDTAQMLAHLDQAERNKYNQLTNGVNGVSMTHPGAPPRGMVMVDRPRPIEPVIFRRGVPGNRGDKVPRRFLQVLEHVDGGQPFQQGSGRLELARAIASPDNPLTARVIVNRIWQHQFGEGLVRTSSDFGTRGEPPTHPQLLDYLAAEFMADGWSIKRLQRRIMLSRTWQQTSELLPDAAERDPENRLLWQMPRRRMEFEPLRDHLLSAAGRLDETIGGRSAMIHQDSPRRGLYAYIDREDLPGLLASFDLPSPDASQAQRSETTVPQQALYLMNSAFVIEQARALATRSAAAGEQSAGEQSAEPKHLQQRIERLYRLALARDPDAVELQAAVDFVAPAAQQEAASSPQAGSAATDSMDPWVQLAQVLLLCNEFAFVD